MHPGYGHQPTEKQRRESKSEHCGSPRIPEYRKSMSISRTKALEYAYELISVPRAHLRVHLKQTKEGVSLRYRGRVMTKVYMNRSGMNAASAMAQALGVPIPKLGESISALVSTGTLYRVLALSELDYRKPESFEVAARLIDDAIDQRGGVRGDV